MPAVDLTPFGFTPTESRVYEVLLTERPGHRLRHCPRCGPGPGQRLQRPGGVGGEGCGPGRGGPAQAIPPRTTGHSPGPDHQRPGPGPGAAGTVDRGPGLGRVGDPGRDRVAPGRTPASLPRHCPCLSARCDSSRPPEAFPILAPVLRRAVAMGLDVRLWSTGEASAPLHRGRAGFRLRRLARAAAGSHRR